MPEEKDKIKNCMIRLFLMVTTWRAKKIFARTC